MLAITGFQAFLLNWALPGIIGAILAYLPLMAVISSLHKLLDKLIAANADGKISNAEYTEICDVVEELKSSFISLLSIFLKGKTMKMLLMLMIICMGLAMTVLPGCLWADATTKSTLNSAATVVSALNDKCQDVNNPASCDICRQGLQRAATTLNRTATLANGGKAAE